jgi:hypothetical protein
VRHSGAARAASIVALLAGGCASAALAQVIEPPPRLPLVTPARRGVNASSEQLSLTVDALGGYDDSLPTLYSDGSQTFVANPSGYTGFGNALLHYRRGTQSKWMDVSGRAFMNAYQNLGDGPGYGGEETFSAHSTAGRRTQFGVSQRLRSAQYYGLGTFASLPIDAGQAIDGNAKSAVARERARLFDSSASMTQQWTRRTSTGVTYDFIKQSYANNASVDTRAHSASVTYEHGLRRTTTLQSSYTFTSMASLEPTHGLQHLQTNDLNAGLTYVRNFSATRRMVLSGGGGAIRYQTARGAAGIPLQELAPAGYGNARVDLARTWSLNSDYRRSVTVLQGQVLGAFVTDAGSLSIGGFLSRRTEVVFSGAYSTGQPQQLPAALTGTFDSYIGTGQLRVLLTDSSSLIVNYTRYQYHLDRLISSTLGVPPNVLRNTFQIGYSMFLPLVSSPKVPTQGGPGRRIN